MRKLKFFIHIDQEERWLNEMAGQGYHFTHKGLGYHFQAGKPEQANYRIDYRLFKNRKEYADYLALFEDSGWEHVAGSKQSGAQYFKRTDGNASEDIFSDTPSKAARYKRMSQMWLITALCLIPIVSALISNGMIEISALFHPKLLYYTPGLWEKEGSAFWKSFLFETPFALMRVVVWAAIPLTILLSVLFAAKADAYYRKAR